MSEEAQKTEEDISEEELEKIIQDVAEEDKPTAKVAPILSAAKSEPAKVEELKAKAPNAEQSLSLELSGVVNLKLSFSSGERSIQVVCSEEALVCTMADGTEFRIPTGMARKREAA